MPERDRKKEERKKHKHDGRKNDMNTERILGNSENLKSKVLSLKYPHGTGFTSKCNQESAGHIQKLVASRTLLPLHIAKIKVLLVHTSGQTRKKKSQKHKNKGEGFRV